MTRKQLLRTWVAAALVLTFVGVAEAVQGNQWMSVLGFAAATWSWIICYYTAR